MKRLDEIQRRMQNNPKWRLDPSFVRNIFKISLSDARAALQTLKERGVVTELVHINCKECDSGLAFVYPEDADSWEEGCDICLGERDIFRGKRSYFYRTVYTTGPEMIVKYKQG